MERIIEILLYLLSHSENKKIDDIVMQKLIKKGYSDSEISTAYSWIYEKQKASNTETSASNKNFRILNDNERALFTDKAWADIQQMVKLGLLTNTDVETIIEQVTFSGYKNIDSNYIKSIVGKAIFIPNNNNFSTIFLNGSESIN